MSTIASPVSDIAKLTISPLGKLPHGKPLKIARAVRVGACTVLIDEHNRLWSNVIRDRTHYALGVYPFTTKLMQALKVCGVVSAEGVKEHLRRASEYESNREARHAAYRFKEAAEDLGVTLSKVQQRKVRGLLGEESA